MRGREHEPRKKRQQTRSGRRTPRGRGAGTRQRAERAREVNRILAREYPEARTALEHRDPYQLLVATILSAQCTDERVNQVTKVLFQVAPDAEHLAAMPREELEAIIRPTGFYRNKAKNIQGAARAIVERFGGRVPDTMDELTSLPGVARKTANVVLGSAFGKACGIVVDTHVKRVARRLGLTDSQDPVRIEQDLMELLPQEEWIAFSHRLIFHGRRVCKARKPRCDACVLSHLCPAAETGGVV